MKRYFRRLPADASAVAEVRRELTAWAAVADRAARQDLSLAVSEVVSNSVRHGPALGQITVEARTQAESVRVLVCDSGSGGPIGMRTPDAQGGRGLRMLDALSLSWGVTRDPTCVWFVMRTVA